jgi:hypothetical protein
MAPRVVVAVVVDAENSQMGHGRMIDRHPIYYGGAVTNEVLVSATTTHRDCTMRDLAFVCGAAGASTHGAIVEPSGRNSPVSEKPPNPGVGLRPNRIFSPDFFFSPSRRTWAARCLGKCMFTVPRPSISETRPRHSRSPTAIGRQKTARDWWWVRSVAPNRRALVTSDALFSASSACRCLLQHAKRRQLASKLPHTHSHTHTLTWSTNAIVRRRTRFSRGARVQAPAKLSADRWCANAGPHA